MYEKQCVQRVSRKKKVLQKKSQTLCHIYDIKFMNDALCLSSNSNNEHMLCFKLRAFGSNLYQQSQGLTCYMAQAETSSHYIMVPAF